MSVLVLGLVLCFHLFGASAHRSDSFWPRTPAELQAEAWARREKGREGMWSAGMVTRIKRTISATPNPVDLEQCAGNGGLYFPIDVQETSTRCAMFRHSSSVLHSLAGHLNRASLEL